MQIAPNLTNGPPQHATIIKYVCTYNTKEINVTSTTTYKSRHSEVKKACLHATRTNRITQTDHQLSYTTAKCAH